MVIHVVKATFVPISQSKANPANAGAAREHGVSLRPVPDTATAHPKQARYQLRYTRLFDCRIRLGVFSQNGAQDRADWATDTRCAHQLLSTVPKCIRKVHSSDAEKFRFRRSGEASDIRNVSARETP